RERGPDPAALRDEADAGARDLVGAAAGEIDAIEVDGAAARAEQAHDGGDQGGLADAVAAEQCDDAAARDPEGDAVQDGALLVAGAQAADVEQRRVAHDGSAVGPAALGVAGLVGVVELVGTG